MPLSDPAPRRHLFSREIHCRGHLREDGLWDVEARVLDTRSYAFNNHWRGDVEPGEPVHLMEVRLTVDDDFGIVAAEAATMAAPYEVCPLAAEGFGRLAGLRIGPGWLREARRRYGRREGCTHLFELLGPLATAAFQTIMPWRENRLRERGLDESESMRGGPGPNSCRAFAESSPVVKRLWPESHREAG